MEFGSVAIIDPYSGKVEIKARNIRNHPLDHMMARGRITDAQLEAGNRFLLIWERSEIGGARAIDPGQIKVDTSYWHRGLALGVMAATADLNAIETKLGRRAYTLLVRIIGHRQSPFDLVRDAGGGVYAPAAAHISASFKEALDDLAVHFGCAKGPRRRRYDDGYSAMAAARIEEVK